MDKNIEPPWRGVITDTEARQVQLSQLFKPLTKRERKKLGVLAPVVEHKLPGACVDAAARSLRGKQHDTSSTMRFAQICASELKSSDIGGIFDSLNQFFKDRLNKKGK